MRLSPVLLSALLGVAALLLTVVFLHRAAPASCADAAAQQDEGLVRAAMASYAAILSEEPRSGCAKQGMQRAVRELCLRARVLRKAGAVEEAKKVYVSLLAADVPDWMDKADNWGVGCAVVGLNARSGGASNR